MRKFILLSFIVFFKISMALCQTGKKPQFITYEPIGNLGNISCFDSIITLSVTASSQLEVRLEVVSGPASISGNVLTILPINFKVGSNETSIEVKASQAGNDTICPATVSIPIYINSKILEESSVVSANSFYCEGESFTIAPKTIDSVNYRWIFPDSKILNSKDLSFNNVNTSVSGIYRLYLYKGVCRSELNYITLNIKPYPEIHWLNEKESIPYDSLPFTFQFEPNNGMLHVNDTYMLGNIFNSSASGIYNFSYSITESGCMNTISGSFFSALMEPPVVYRIITPNNDRKNDFLTIDHIENYADYELIIFDSWGNIIFNKTNDYDFPPATIAAGNYYYELNIKKPVIKKSGNLLIVK